MYIITAGAGRGSFNHRYAQPSRDGHRYSAFLYPTDIFPFSSQAQTDPVTGVTDGLLQHLADPTHAPRIFYVNTGYEYWGRSASLIHTDLNGTADITPLPNERIYHVASGQHYVDAFPPRQSVPGGFQGNPLELRLTYRALLIRLVEWAEGKAEAPPSRYPTFAAGELKRVEALGFPAIPGVQVPQVTNHPYRADYGDRWPQGIIDRQPPLLGYAFPVVVPALDELGNERSGIQSVELRVPLATYTPWSLRRGYPAAQNELIDFRGYWLPLPATEAIRRATGDPRSSIEALYPTPEAFQQEVAKAANQLIQEGFLLPEDRTAVAARQQQYWDFLHPAGAKAPTKGPANGSLIIIGGGRLDSVFYQKFMELAGGPDAPIVIIPTAGEDSFLEREGSEEQIKNPFAAAGFRNITVLHTRDPQVANTDAFTAPLKQAKGVWFSGGRQWRLADSYLHTQTQEAINDVLARGGVIAGTSAGASIQGSLLVRGDTNGNTLMLGDHTEGFGLVSQVAIDQHLLARNRQFDMFSVTKQYPDLLGIGLDENTGIVVQGNMFSVIGKSYVAIYNSEETISESNEPGDGMPRFLLLHQGDRFNLVERRLIRD
ncbi:MAG: cyanophycinase [Lewinellaceae bacterium]|nr:cyanophycinase [Lewinellaceae bacterium]